MSKGTKQFRLGRVIRVINQMEIVLNTLEDAYKRLPSDYGKGMINQLNRDIETLKSEFNIED